MGWISNTINRPGISTEERRLRIFHLVTTAITLPLLCVAIVIAISTRDWTRAFAELMLSAALVASTFWLARSDDSRWAYRFNLFVFGGMLVTLCVLPEMKGNGFVWIFLFPPAAFFVRGPHEGFLWAFALLMALAVALTLPLGLTHLEALDWAFKGRLLASYLALMLVTCGYEVVRARLFSQVLAEREQLEAEQVKLNEARLVAEEATAAKSRFLANMSHEIRTPLHGTLGMLHLLHQDTLDELQRETVETARRSAASLLRIIDDVLDVSKIEAGHLALEETELDLKRILEDVADLFRGHAKQAGLAFALTVADDVPRHLRGDPGRIRQVLSNLVANAMKFTQEGEVELRVTTEGRSGRDATLRFDVVDTGIGIASDVGDAVFEPFTQADGSTTRPFGGSGLGLAIAGELARLMGGEITFESVPEKGSTFSFTLRAAIVEEPRARDPQLSTHPPADNGKQRILLAEDNVVNQRVAARMLEKLGCQVEVAADGVKALEAIERDSFDLVMMDCQMPRLDGYEATARIKADERSSHIPIIALTAHAMKGDRERCFAAGMDDYLAKPFSPEDLQRVLDRWCPDDRKA